MVLAVPAKRSHDYVWIDVEKLFDIDGVAAFRRYQAIAGKRVEAPGQHNRFGARRGVALRHEAVHGFRVVDLGPLWRGNVLDCGCKPGAGLLKRVRQGFAARFAMQAAPLDSGTIPDTDPAGPPRC